MKLLVFLLGLATLPSLLLAAGINCKGSIKCGGAAISGWGGDDKDHAVTLSEYIHSLDNATWIPNGHQIACTRTICAFLQNTEGLWAEEVKGLARNINEHGCKRCGSSPVHYPENNDGTYGQLTFNYINERCGHVLDGVCGEFADAQIVHGGKEKLKEEKEAKQAAKEAAQKEKEDEKLAEIIAEKVKEELTDSEAGDAITRVYKDHPADAPTEMWQEKWEPAEPYAAKENMPPRRWRRRGMANVILSS